MQEQNYTDLPTFPDWINHSLRMYIPDFDVRRHDLNRLFLTTHFESPVATEFKAMLTDLRDAGNNLVLDMHRPMGTLPHPVALFGLIVRRRRNGGERFVLFFQGGGDRTRWGGEATLLTFSSVGNCTSAVEAFRENKWAASDRRGGCFLATFMDLLGDFGIPDLASLGNQVFVWADMKPVPVVRQQRTAATKRAAEDDLAADVALIMENNEERARQVHAAHGAAQGPGRPLHPRAAVLRLQGVSRELPQADGALSRGQGYRQEARGAARAGEPAGLQGAGDVGRAAAEDGL
jgi:hypothetical protein